MSHFMLTPLGRLNYFCWTIEACMVKTSFTDPLWLPQWTLWGPITFLTCLMEVTTNKMGLHFCVLCNMELTRLEHWLIISMAEKLNITCIIIIRMWKSLITNIFMLCKINLYILSCASEVGSPTNPPCMGSGQWQDTGSGILTFDPLFTKTGWTWYVTILSCAGGLGSP